MRERPDCLVPTIAASTIAAALVLTGALPARPVSAPAVAAFPADLFFDVKHALGHAPGWLAFAALVGLGIAGRSAVLAGTLWLAEGRPGSFTAAWTKTARIAMLGALAFIPGAVLFYAGVALRYAPFVWVAALLSMIPVMLVARRAAALDLGIQLSPAAPSPGSLIAYGYFIAVLGALVWFAGGIGRWVAALLFLLAAPVHVVVLLGWRAVSLGGAREALGRSVAAVTALLLLAFGVAVVFDRERGQPPAGSGAPELEGTLLLLGGADSTSKTGPLAGFDPRSVGYRAEQTRLLSYSATDERYEMRDTRADLVEVARSVSEQVRAAERPVALLGHSQAAVILDLMIERGLEVPDRAVVISGPPPAPPKLSAPAPGERGPGAVGAAITRLFADALAAAGVASFDIDAPAAPTNLPATAAPAGVVDRLAVWPVGDSVWLDGDWRRPGETNVVVLSDHVGAVKNSHALEAARTFFRSARVQGDEGSWRAVIVNALRFAFEPWRP